MIQRFDCLCAAIFRAWPLERARLASRQHAVTCPDCRREATFDDALRELFSQGKRAELSSVRRDRLLLRAFSAEATNGDYAPTFRLDFGLAAIAVLCALVAGFIWGTARLTPRQPAPADHLIAGRIEVDARALDLGAALPAVAALSAGRNGAIVRIGPARATLTDGAEAVWNRGANRLTLRAGSLTLDVDHTREHPFEIATTAFVVQVVGTRLTVTSTRVEVFEGTVRVRSAASPGPEWTVSAGQVWTADQLSSPVSTARPAVALDPEMVEDRSPRGPSRPAPARRSRPPKARPAGDLPGRAAAEIDGGHQAPDARFEPPASANGSRVRPAETRQAAEPSAQVGAKREARTPVQALLEQAHRALARKDADAARAAVAAAREQEGGMDRASAAEAETVLAECAQAAGNVRDAVRRYVAIGQRYPELPAAEDALFAAARLEASSGERSRARVLLREYLARYPGGRFRSEAIARLTRIADE